MIQGKEETRGMEFRKVLSTVEARVVLTPSSSSGDHSHGVLSTRGAPLPQPWCPESLLGIRHIDIVDHRMVELSLQSFQG